MHSHIALCFMLTGHLNIIIRLRRSLNTRPIIYKDKGVVHKKLWHDPESLIGGNILVSF